MNDITRIKSNNKNQIVEEKWESPFLIQVTKYKYENERIIEEKITQTEKETKSKKILLLYYSYSKDGVLVKSLLSDLETNYYQEEFYPYPLHD
jgi:hypothetical protein